MDICSVARASHICRKKKKTLSLTEGKYDQGITTSKNNWKTINLNNNELRSWDKGFKFSRVKEFLYLKSLDSRGIFRASLSFIVA